MMFAAFGCLRPVTGGFIFALPRTNGLNPLLDLFQTLLRGPILKMSFRYSGLRARASETAKVLSKNDC